MFLKNVEGSWKVITLINKGMNFFEHLEEVALPMNTCDLDVVLDKRIGVRITVEEQTVEVGIKKADEFVFTSCSK